MYQVTCVICHVSPGTCHLSLTPTATATEIEYQNTSGWLLRVYILNLLLFTEKLSALGILMSPSPNPTLARRGEGGIFLVTRIHSIPLKLTLLFFMH